MQNGVSVRFYGLTAPIAKTPHTNVIGTKPGSDYLVAMSFWILAAFLTLLASLALLVPLARQYSDAASDVDSDLAVYQDQYRELDRDVERGAINAAEADEARAEIGRRILKVAHKRDRLDANRNGRTGKTIATLAVLAVPLASWGIYAAIGSPHLPAQPLVARLDANPAENTVQELVARAELHLSANPDDGRGWEVIAPIYQRLGNFGEAATAWGNAIRLLGSTATREVAHGEAIASAAGGTITPEARAAFERALVLEPKNFKARFFLAAVLAQEGDEGEAASSLRALLSDIPAGSPWRETIVRAIADLEGHAAAESDAKPADDLISDNDQAEMIAEMVAGLDRRLREQPDDAAGWQRLVRSYVVLRKPDAALEALERGMAALDGEAAAQLQQFAAGLGVTVKE